MYLRKLIARRTLDAIVSRALGIKPVAVSRMDDSDLRASFRK